MKLNSFGFQVLIAVFLITGCSQPIGPSKNKIVENYQEHLNEKGASVKVSSFGIEQTENLGTKTEPEIHSRYKATFKLDESKMIDRHKEELKKIGFSGKDVIKVYGIAISERSGDDWETKFNVEKTQDLINDTTD